MLNAFLLWYTTKRYKYSVNIILKVNNDIKGLWPFEEGHTSSSELFSVVAIAAQWMKGERMRKKVGK